MNRSVLLALAAILAAVPSAMAQTGGTCVPVAERAGRALGCFITARQEFGSLAGSPPLYWHLDAYPTREAAERARAPRSTVVESYGRIWLFTIAPAEWRPSGGTRVEWVGPLPLVKAEKFAAVYMQGTFEPGMESIVHRHPGAEAWVTLQGSMCLETPDGRIEQRAGQPGVLVGPGIPMVLTGTGKGIRQSLVLVLQDAGKPRSVPAPDWTPRHVCR